MTGARPAQACFSDSHRNFPAAVREYEREMFARADAAARLSARMHDLLTSPGAARNMLAFFQRD